MGLNTANNVHCHTPNSERLLSDEPTIELVQSP